MGILIRRCAVPAAPRSQQSERTRMHCVFPSYHFVAHWYRHDPLQLPEQGQERRTPRRAGGTLFGLARRYTGNGVYPSLFVTIERWLILYFIDHLVRVFIVQR